VINCAPFSFISSFLGSFFYGFVGSLAYRPSVSLMSFGAVLFFSLSQLANCKLMSPKWQPNQFAGGEENRMEGRKTSDKTGPKPLVEPLTDFMPLPSDRPACQFVNCQYIFIFA